MGVSEVTIRRHMEVLERRDAVAEAGSGRQLG
jgi:predicted ArsR family transcriptional regulator